MVRMCQCKVLLKEDTQNRVEAASHIFFFGGWIVKNEGEIQLPLTLCIKVPLLSRGGGVWGFIFLFFCPKMNFSSFTSFDKTGFCFVFFPSKN